MDYFFKSISEDAQIIHETLKRKSSNLQNIIVTAFFGSLSAIFQSAGGFFPGVGYLISPLATGPIIFCSIISFRLGLMSYGLTLFLLMVLQPSELIVFPFTTGLLGLGIGVAYRTFTKRFSIMLCGAISLLIGIIILLYGIGFPLLGPIASTTFSYSGAGILLIFSIFYSWLWTDASYAILKKCQKGLF